MGEYWIVNSEQTKENVKREIDAVFLDKKYARVKIDAGKRTLSQNALKSVWYGDIAKYRGDVTAKDVERECKYKYGLPIIRRSQMQNYVHENITDKIGLKIKQKTITKTNKNPKTPKTSKKQQTTQNKKNTHNCFFNW